MTMDHLSHLRRDADALLTAAARDLDAPVMHCPGWNVAELVWHIGEIHDLWVWITTEEVTRPEELEAYVPPRRPADQELVSWAQGRADHLVAVLSDLDPAARRWNWSRAPDTGAWIPRRMAHETAVHRLDAEMATGATPQPIPAELAADGIDEFLRLFAPGLGDYDGPAGWLELLATDVDRGWTVELSPPDARLTGPLGGTEVAHLERVRGDADQLLRSLWGRGEHPVHGELMAAFFACSER